MADKSLFPSARQALRAPRTDALNRAGGIAYTRSPEQALAQIAATGCLGSTFYASGMDQLQDVLELCGRVDAETVAKTAVYGRRQAFMKDLPALLVAALSVRSPEMLTRAFPLVIDNGRMLRNFVQIMRSGAVGRRSLGSLPKRLIREWLDSRSDEALFRASVGTSPSLADIIKMVHPKPKTDSRRALYGYLIGRDVSRESLPELVQRYEKLKANPKGMPLPDVPFQMIAGLEIGTKQWKGIARRAGWQMTRMNLNTFLRHGVLQDAKMVGFLADRLRDPEQIKRAKVFPYQLLVAWQNASSEIPSDLRRALHDAMEIALSNVPEIPGKIYVFPDISGSMHAPVSGYRPGATSKVTCVQVAGLVAAALMRRNPQTEVLPFGDRVVNVQLRREDSVMENARKLASLPAGGTNCSAPLKELNRRGAKGDLVIYVSDNESWMDSHPRWLGSSTETVKSWEAFKRRNPRAQLICIDLTPNTLSQVKERQDVFNIGGFSDQVFRLIGQIGTGRAGGDHWVHEIRQVRL